MNADSDSFTRWSRLVSQVCGLVSAKNMDGRRVSAVIGDNEAASRMVLRTRLERQQKASGMDMLGIVQPTTVGLDGDAVDAAAPGQAQGSLTGNTTDGQERFRGDKDWVTCIGRQ